MTAPALPDLLRKAADIIGERGWNRGSDIHNETGGVCANGALRVALGDSARVNDYGRWELRAPLNFSEVNYLQLGHAHRALAERLVSQLGETIPGSPLVPSAIFFNDKVAKDGAEVQQLFRDTADWLESHPLATVAAVEDEPVPYSLTQAGVQALDNKDLVSA